MLARPLALENIAGRDSGIKPTSKSDLPESCHPSCLSSPFHVAVQRQMGIWDPLGLALLCASLPLPVPCPSGPQFPHLWSIGNI